MDIFGQFVSIPFVFMCMFAVCGAIQCFSCKGSGLNEVAANIHCLEKGYLENCDDFYEYYSKVEDKKVLTDEYYYEDEEEYYYDDEGFEASSEDYYSSRKRRAREIRRELGNNTNVLQNIDETQGINIENGKEIKTIILNDESKGVNVKEKDALSSKQEKKVQNDTPKSSSQKHMTLPKDSEHHCYSTTIKQEWEQYSVEKGCKKIAYCKSDMDTKPEWTRPWNFCCDKSRCNAKQVKDKPQRIYGMNCRRTDDCIQGHVSRSVCPHLFKSCPKIPPSLIKMECIAKGADPADFKERYRNPFQEKKCLCTAGNFPRGPVCTNNGQILNLQSCFWFLAIVLLFL